MQRAFELLVLALSTNPVIWIGLVFVFSLLIGSFLNVVIHRVPIMLDREWRSQAEQILSEQRAADGGQSEHVGLKADLQHSGPPAAGLQPPAAPYNLFVPRSACPKCGAMITAWQNIPVVSYLLLRGKCAKCGQKISPRYPLVELGTAILSALVAWKFGFVWYTGAALVLTWTLIALARHRCRYAASARQHHAAARLAGTAAESRNDDSGHRTPRRHAIEHHRRRRGVPEPVERVSPVQDADRQGRHGIWRLQAVRCAWRVARLANAAA